MRSPRVNAEAVIGQVLEWLGAGRQAALATVVSTWGSSPRPVGSQLAVNDLDEFAGSVSGGCVEGDVIEQCRRIMGDGGGASILEYQVADERAWEVGLTCGGTVVILVNTFTDVTALQTLHQCQRQRQTAALLIHCQNGQQATITASTLGASLPVGGPDLAQLQERLTTGTSGLLSAPGGQWCCRVFQPPFRLVVVGAVHISQALVPMAQLAGLDVTLVDPRTAFANSARFPDAEIVTDWPDRYFERRPPDAATAVVLLSHDPKIDDPALIAALGSPAPYVGALGSRKTHTRRLARLAEAGIAAAELARIHAPIGLDLGGRKPTDIAIAILAEIVSVRSGSADGL
jgi:xanthine dehydrogenase accessory factor